MSLLKLAEDVTFYWSHLKLWLLTQVESIELKNKSFERLIFTIMRKNTLNFSFLRANFKNGFVLLPFLLQMLRKRHNGSIHRPDSQQAVKSPPLLVRTKDSISQVHLLIRFRQGLIFPLLCLYGRNLLTRTVNRSSNFLWVQIHLLVSSVECTEKDLILLLGFKHMIGYPV